MVVRSIATSYRGQLIVLPAQGKAALSWLAQRFSVFCAERYVV